MRTAGREDYDQSAVIYDPVLNRVYRMDEPLPDDGHVKYIGYKYLSKVRTLPAVGRGMPEPKRLARINIRLEDSELPFFNGYPEGDGNMNKITDRQRRRSGVFSAPVPGTNHPDAAYEMQRPPGQSFSFGRI
jgi:hypothetical protein